MADLVALWDERPEPTPVMDITSERAWPEFDDPGIQEWLEKVRAHIEQQDRSLHELREGQAGWHRLWVLTDRKLQDIKEHIKNHRAEMPMILWSIPEADPAAQMRSLHTTKIEQINSDYIDWFKELKQILGEIPTVPLKMQTWCQEQQTQPKEAP